MKNHQTLEHLLGQDVVREELPQRSAAAGRGRWWGRGLLACVVTAAIAAASGLFARALMTPNDDPRLTHTITRGDLLVTVTESGTLESSENTEIKCRIRGRNTVLWVVESGTVVEPGDELIRLDSLFMEEQIDERTKYAHWSRSSAERSKANVVAAELAISEYEQGRYVTELMQKEKQLVIAESKLRSAENILEHIKKMAQRGYVSELELEEKDFAVMQAKLDVVVARTQVDVLERFTKAEQMKTLTGNLGAVKASHEANAERAIADASRRDRALEEFKYCVVKAERGGLVIHPSAAKWETQPIAEGSTVHKDQVLLLMPDLSKMQVKVGIHESMIDRMSAGLSAKITLPNKKLEGTVSSVASVAQPAGWWSNEVRYDTTIRLPAGEGLKPGMSAEVEVLIARYEDVLTIPVAAIVETDDGNFCWVKTPSGTRRRQITLGDSNDVFTVVEQGLSQGDQVLLHPPTVPVATAAGQVEDDSDSSDQRVSSEKQPESAGQVRQVKPADAGNYARE